MTGSRVFLKTICAYRPYLWLGVMVHIFLFLLTMIGLLFGRPGTASHTLSIVNFGILAVSGTGTFSLFYVCTRRETAVY